MTLGPLVVDREEALPLPPQGREERGMQRHGHVAIPAQLETGASYSLSLGWGRAKRFCGASSPDGESLWRL